MGYSLSFTASCRRGHDLVAFTDRAEFEAHMTGVHGVRRRYPGGDPYGFGIWEGRFRIGQKPYPWKAPRPSARGLEGVVGDIRSGKYGEEYERLSR